MPRVAGPFRRFRGLARPTIAFCLAVLLCLAPPPAGAAPAGLPTDAELAQMSREELEALLARLNRALAPPAPVAIAGIGSGLGGGAGRSLWLAHANRLDAAGASDDAIAAGFSAGIGTVAGWNISLGLGATLRESVDQPRQTLSLRLQRPFAGVPAGVTAGVALTMTTSGGDGVSQTATSGSVALSLRRAPSSAGPARRTTMATIGLRVTEGAPSPDIFGGFGIGLSPQLAASLAHDGRGPVAGLHLWPGRDGGVQITITLRAADGRRSEGFAFSRSLGR